MNNDFELENMRRQMDMLKKKLKEQEIVNDRIIRQSLRSTTSSINRRYRFTSVLCLLMIPYSYWAFVMLNGSSIGVWIATVVLMLLAFGYTVYNGWHLNDTSLYSHDLLAARQKVAKAKKMDSDWLMIGIPLGILWTGYYLYDMYAQMPGDEFKYFVIVISMAAIIGGAIGLKIHYRNQRNYQEIIDQIQDLTAEG